MCFAEIDLNYVENIREMQPVFSHRRSDLYTLHVNERSAEDGNLKFSEFTIPNSHVFYSTPHSFAFVNLKPVTDGREFL